jgi:hypothetical protein
MAAEVLSAFYWREQMAPITGRPEYRPKPPARRKSAEAEALRRRVVALIGAGISTADIAREIGCSQRYIQVLAKGKP